MYTLAADRLVARLVAQREQRSSAHQPVYRIGQLILGLVARVSRLCAIIRPGLVSRERRFFGLDPLAGGIKDCIFIICHVSILAVSEAGVGTVATHFWSILCPNAGHFPVKDLMRL